MKDTVDVLRMAVSAQLPVSVFLAVLMWSLHARLRRHEFNRWWVSAWTLSAVFLAMSRLALAFPPGWTAARGVVVLLTTLTGFLVAPVLVFGALSFRPNSTIRRPLALGGLGTALALGAFSFAASLQWPDLLTSFAVRHGPRTLALAGALFFCSWVFFQRARATRSWAALLTSGSCFVYALNQCVYTGAQLVQVFGAVTGVIGDAGRLAMVVSVRLLYSDVLLTCGICLGTVLLLVEEYQRSERALLESVSRGRKVEDENTALQQEILARQQVEAHLRASEDQYRDLVEHSEDLLCTHTLDGRILSCNPAAARLLGYEVHDLLTRRVVDFLAPEVRDQFAQHIKVLQRDGVASGLMKVMTRRGERRLWAFRNTLRTDGVEVPIVRGTGHDVTEQHQAERALRLSEEKFAAAFRSSPCAMAITSLHDGRFIDVNESFERQMGFSRAEVVGHASLDFGIWRDQAAYAATYTELTETGQLPQREVQLRTKSGQMMTAILSATTITVNGTKCVLSVGVDVTSPKETEARHRAILRALPDWVFLTSHEGIFLEFHARDQRHLVMPPNEFLGRHVMDVLPPDLATQLLATFQRALRLDQPATLEYSLWSGDEPRFYEVRSVAADRDHVLSLVRDVTDQRRAEQRARDLQDELAHADRVLAMGTLTGSLAHEINQPLTAITTNAYVGLRMLAGGADHAQISDALSDIANDSRRIDDVLRRLRQLLKKGGHERAPVDVNLIVKDVMTLVHANLVQRRVSIEAELAPDLPNVIGDRIQLQQVVLNILMNAAEAVSVTENADDRYVKVTTELKGTDVVVSITDRGTGVSDAELERMFDPFFTTRQDGMGLGLSICRTIMDAHAGQIAARRNADRGLTCWFSLNAASFSSEAVSTTGGTARLEGPVV